MREVECRGLTFGKGRAKICVPLVGDTCEKVIEEIKVAQNLPADFLEWRADCLKEDESRLIKYLKENTQRFPVLATLRTADEGGNWKGSKEEYLTVLNKFIESKVFDIIDIELSCGENEVKSLINKAKESKMTALVSKHDFNATPNKDEIVKTLVYMQSLGADLPKYAVMPQSMDDVLTLLSASLKANELAGPVVAISMGDKGKISRVCSAAFGSAVTFAAGKDASAPGQLLCDDIFKMMKALDLK